MLDTIRTGSAVLSDFLMRVEFLSRGLKLAGLVDLPEGPPRAFAVMASCFTCSKNSKTAAYLARGLAVRGIGCLRIDFKGLGESEGEFVKNTLSSNVEDLIAAAEFLRREFSPPRLMIGHSFGGTAAVRAGRRIDSCRAVAVVNSPSDPKRITTYFPERLREIRVISRAAHFQSGAISWTIWKRMTRNVRFQSWASHCWYVTPLPMKLCPSRKARAPLPGRDTQNRFWL
jgi:alpha/beta superfamily hydrolase